MLNISQVNFINIKSNKSLKPSLAAPANKASSLNQLQTDEVCFKALADDDDDFDFDFDF